MTSNVQAPEVDRDVLARGIISKNNLLKELLRSSAHVRDYLSPRLQVVSLDRNQVIQAQGDAIEFVYFPIDCVVSGLVITEDGTTVETSMVGHESMVGVSAILGTQVARQWIWVCISGLAIELQTKCLERVVVQNEAALKSLLACYRSLITQVSQRCVCNTRHTVLERLCCWLLMVHDRVGGANLRLTQEMIASRLGSRRAGITVAAGLLQNMKAIEYRRGQLHIRDRAVLERAVCECYWVMQVGFKRNSS